MNARRPRPAIQTAIVLAVAPQVAHAHLISTGLGPIYDGITHFGVTPEFVLPVLAAAVLGGLRGRTHARRIVFALPLAWLLAGIASVAGGVAMPDAPAWVTLALLGGLVAADVRLPVAATTAIAVLLGIALGYANGASLGQAGAGLRGVLGSTAALFVVVTLGAAAAAAWQAGWLRIAWRVAGSWIAAGGVLLLGWSLR